jgi:hypothetical protein
MNQEEEESETGTLEKHYQVTMDFKMLIRPITPEVCQESFFFSDKSASVDEPYFRENIERLKRLYKLLLNNQTVLEQYLLYVLTQEAGRFAYQGLTDAFDAKDEDELLVPLLKSLGEEDRRFFEECRELNALGSNTELIATAFKVEWVGTEIGEMNRRVEGDVKRAQIVEETKMRLIKDFNSAR